MFQKKVLNRYIKNLNEIEVTKAFYELGNFFEKIENIKKVKEENYQYGFLEDFFVKGLGYILNPSPNYNLTTEFKNESDSKKADGAILKDNLPIAVIELKSTKLKSMDKIVNQAFNYKNNHPTCSYVITSNFEKLRLYIEHSNDFIEFDLFNLSLEKFKKIYLLLSRDNLINDIPKKIKDDSKVNQESIANEFYKKYSDLRVRLFENIVNKNEIKKEIALSLSQKLLDRFIFIFFAEDKSIIESKTTEILLNQYKNDWDGRELYHFVKYVFKAIDKGNSKLNISAYNGGLFKENKILDDLQIDSDVLLEIVNLSNYDFDSEIDVNILGHIFENSLDDLEKIKKDLFGDKFDINKLKRKKDGIFYTPNYITDYIIKNTIGTICNNKKIELEIDNLDNNQNLKKDDIQKFNEYKKFLLELKIIDPACGSGAFLNQSFNYLHKEYKFTFDFLNKYATQKQDLFLGESIDTQILENNLFGVDINEESIEIAKLSLWLKTAKQGRKLTNLNNNIKCGNSLIDDKEIDKKAFKWNEEFKEIFDKGGFDVVIGNPPYGAKIDEKSKEFYYENYKTIEYQLDTYVIFMERGFNLLKKNGFLSYIVPSTWLTMFYFKKMREYFIKNSIFKNILLFKYQVFENVTAETSIFIFNKFTQNNNFINLLSLNKIENIESKLLKKISQSYWIKNYKIGFNILFSKEKIKLIDKILKNSNLLENSVKITVGIKPYQKGKGNPKQLKDDIKNRIYDSTYKKDETYKQYIVGTNIKKFHLLPSKIKWLKFGRFLAEPRETLNFNQKKIMVRQTSDKIISAIDYSGYLSLNNIHNILINENSNIKYETLLCILNSKLIDFYYKFLVPEKGRTFAEVKVVNLKKLPLIKNIKTQKLFISKANLMIKLNENLQKAKDSFFGELKVEKLSKKLQNFEKLELNEFVKELAKAKKLRFRDRLDERIFKEDWNRIFENDKEIVLEIKNEINKTDKEIDKMVYELYELNKEEIKIIEDN